MQAIFLIFPIYFHIKSSDQKYGINYNIKTILSIKFKISINFKCNNDKFLLYFINIG